MGKSLRFLKITLNMTEIRTLLPIKKKKNKNTFDVCLGFVWMHKWCCEAVVNVS